MCWWEPVTVALAFRSRRTASSSERLPFQGLIMTSITSAQQFFTHRSRVADPTMHAKGTTDGKKGGRR